MGRVSPYRPSGNSGFTLVELLLANVILMIGLLSAAAMVLYSLSSRYVTKVEGAALQFSQQKMEQLKSLPIDDPQLAGPGNSLGADLKIDFSAAASPQYSSTNELLLNSDRNTSVQFETRWNITATGNQKLITVATRMPSGTASRLEPVNLRVLKGY